MFFPLRARNLSSQEKIIRSIIFSKLYQNLMLKTGQVIYLMQLLGQLISLHKKLTTESSLQKKNVDVYTLVKKRTCLNYFAERKNGGGGGFSTYLWIYQEYQAYIYIQCT